MRVEGGQPNPGAGENPTPNPAEGAGAERQADLPIEEQIRAERQAEAERQNREDERVANDERAHQANLRAENETARLGQAFINQNAYKKFGNFFGITGKLVERSLNRRQEYIEQAQAKLEQEEAHIARCQRELSGKQAQLEQHRERMDKLRTRLEEVTDPGKRAEIQGHINHYDMVMLPLEDAVARMRHEVEYSTHMVRGYSNEQMSYKEELGRSEAYLKVLRTPFSTLWSRNTRIAVGSKFKAPTFEVGRTTTPEVAQRPTTEAEAGAATVPTVESPATPPVNPGVETPPVVEVETQPAPEARPVLEISSQFNPDNYTATFSSGGQEIALTKSALFDLYRLDVTRASNRKEKLNAQVNSIVNDLAIPAEHVDQAKTSVERKLKNILHQTIPEVFSANPTLNQNENLRAHQISTELYVLGRRSEQMDDPMAIQELHNQMSQLRIELNRILDNTKQQLGL